MVHAGCIFVAGIHLSRTWMLGSFGFMRWNSCVHRLDFGFALIRKSLGGMESVRMLTPREKFPLPEDQRMVKPLNAASHTTASPTHSVCVCVWLSSLVCMIGVIFVYADMVSGFYGYFFLCLVGCFSNIIWIGHLLFWVSHMHVFCIFVFAPVQRNWACFTWTGTLQIRSLLLLLLLLL